MTLTPRDNEDEVIRDVLAGNTQAFGILVARYQKPIFNLMLRATRAEHTAADLAQDTFVRAYENLARFRPGARFFSWLYAIGLNRARDWLRGAGTQRREVPLEIDEAQIGDPGINDPRPHIDQHLDLERVGQAVTHLPLEYREAVMLRYHEDLPLKEVAQILGITLSAAKMRVHRALDMLRRALEVENANG